MLQQFARGGGPTDARTAAILIIGNEVLSGKVVDVNSPYLLKELYQLGVRVQRVLTLPDELLEVSTAVRVASSLHDYVFTSGGVGPTHDDVTVAGVAAAFDLPLVLEPRLKGLLEAFHQGPLPPALLRMAMVPEGTQLHFEGQLRYPACQVRNVYLFPGVPELLCQKFQAIRERFREAPYHLVQIYTLQPETVLTEPLEATVAAHPGVALGSYPRYDTPEYKVMLTLESKDLKALQAASATLLACMDPAGLVRVVEPWSSLSAT